ncbi:sulfite reductase (NADPH) [Trichosporon asahii var. asahii CBS 8904]|uniref:assimilatory sulfite reductase (NADPH) n=2 Tax=Trichosporon asahii var. asahii TaxID=189963 RepID=K1VPV9_TRIAC|nr:sulfite reductase (NADPH) [Trichosporon asahii var. asahii CBS 2479]EJT52183.1 sulfite reductase (NADPH) [Trichosporon asahii var. asahii CBS 2479]EKC98722.1 sulfite reductase (NADPH) [Trichosporon asahii var. asahii CBS 8904]
MAPVAVSSPAPAPAVSPVDLKKVAAATNGTATPYSATSTAVSENGDKTLYPGQPGYIDSLVSAQSVVPSTRPGALVYASALEITEVIAFQKSSAVWVYDDALAIGFGTRLPEFEGKTAVYTVQSREGAGQELAGYAKKAQGKISVFASASTLPYLAPQLAQIEGDVIIHIAATEPGADLELGDALAVPGVIKALTQLPEEWRVTFANDPTALYAQSGKVVNVIESTYAGRETTAYKFATAPFEEFEVEGDSNALYVAVASHAADVLKGDKLVLNTLQPEPSKLAAAVAGKKLVVTGPSRADAEALKAVLLATLYAAPGSSAGFNVTTQVTPAAKLETDAKVITFFTAPDAPVAPLVANLFLSSPSLKTSYATYNSVSVKGQKSVVALGETRTVVTPDLASDVVWVSDFGVLKHTNVLATAKEGATLVLELPWSEADVPSKLSAAEIKTIQDKNIRVFLLDLDEAAPTAPIAEQVAFLLLYTGSQKLPKGIWRVLDTYHNGQLGRDAVEEAQAALSEIPAANIRGWDVDPEAVGKVKDSFSWDALAYEPLSGSSKPALSHQDLAVRHILFREAYAVDGAKVVDGVAEIDALAPELPEETFIVTVSENRRLTPESYDRNVFHLELDTANTGLKYAVGEAIGIHGWNDATEVQEFIDWYGLNGDDVVSVPLENGTVATRSVFQLLQQNLDLFGQPGKSFYADLAKLATKREDAMTLKFISVPEGAELFAKLGENETVNFADILKRFPSAHPSIEQLVQLVPEIKPRHYSIASAQAAVGDKVELLIVTVDWVDSTGRTRYGQCTRYTAGLKKGDKVTVSIKPSVMKLPPNDAHPIIMAGLGTGAAPHKAMLQYRALQRSQGETPGECLYYFGSRHRSQEYLYGEEIEAFVAAGVISRAGLAFSRDQKEKIYIQMKMNEDKKMLAKLLLEQNAYFYLCGPTWPVPDVYEALVSALVEEGGLSREKAEQYIEDMKEDERYVLEVY